MSSAASLALRAVAAIALAIVSCVLAPRVARAGDIEDFQAARALYDAHEWTRAISAFESLVGGDEPTLESQALVLESRKYLAAAYVFVGRERAAADQLERLLTEEPTYELDATQFPREVVQLFERVRTRLAERREAEAARAELEAEVVRLRAENEALRAEASRERVVEVPRDQWLMFIPFGVGQLQNGEEGLGWFFAVTEALAVAGLVTTLALELAYIAELQTLDEAAGSRLDQVQAAIDVLGPLNWSFGGALGVLMIAGVVQANVAFTPTRSVRLPARAIEPSVSLRVSPSFVGVVGTF